MDADWTRSPVYAGLTNVLEYGLQGRKIPMNIVDCSDLHDGLSIEGNDE